MRAGLPPPVVRVHRDLGGCLGHDRPSTAARAPSRGGALHRVSFAIDCMIAMGPQPEERVMSD